MMSEKRGLAKRKSRSIVELPESAYTVLDQLDEEMMETELGDYAAREYIYSFVIDGREVTGLSWTGAKALARWMASKGHPMDAVEKDITQDEENWYADIKMVDKETGLALWGSSRQPKLKKLRDGSEKLDRFARTIAMNKAQRNAIRAHVPDKMIAQFIKNAIDEGRVRRVPPDEIETRKRARATARPKGRLLSEGDVKGALGKANISLDFLDFELASDDKLVVRTKGKVADKLVKAVDDVLQGFGGKYWPLQGAWEVPRR